MSGHSKWSSIKHQKGVTDARRGKLFTKLAREITVAAREGGGSDPQMNVRLRLALQKAKDANMPQDNAERAIRRGIGGDAAGDTVAAVIYEGYGPGGTAILLEALTDNKNRTTAEVRAAFNHHGGSLGESGCVSWVFQRTGLVAIEGDQQQLEKLALHAIDNGAEDFKLDLNWGKGTMEIYTAPEKVEDLRRSLEEIDQPIVSADIAMVPQTTVELDDQTARQNLRLLEKLEDLDDTRAVFTNAEFPESSVEPIK